MDVTEIPIDCNCFTEEVNFTGGATAYKDNVKMQEDMDGCKLALCSTSFST